jgi:hypothetical protein
MESDPNHIYFGNHLNLETTKTLLPVYYPLRITSWEKGSVRPQILSIDHINEYMASLCDHLLLILLQELTEIIRKSMDIKEKEMNFNTIINYFNALYYSKWTFISDYSWFVFIHFANVFLKTLMRNRYSNNIFNLAKLDSKCLVKLLV